jgi:hypothetical protein
MSVCHLNKCGLSNGDHHRRRRSTTTKTLITACHGPGDVDHPNERARIRAYRSSREHYLRWLEVGLPFLQAILSDPLTGAAQV